MFGDLASVALRSALDGLAQRQRVSADNIANINTPGFLAGRVSFEGSLRAAVASGPGSVATVRPTTARSLEPTNTNGNNVNLDHETLTEVDTGLRYQLMIKAMDAKYGLIRDALKGGS